MPILETWLLPDGVADVLPEQAQVVEGLRRKSLDFLTSRGYQLVYTPMIEYIESLSSLSETGKDLDLVTFKLIDQLSGRLIGVRADITPQVARIDAHVRPIQGVARYCYAGTILHTQAQGLHASRSPLQLGAELYGHASISADIEMIDVMLGLVKQAEVAEKLHLDLGHVGLFRSMVRLAGLTKAQEHQLSNIYQRKSLPELAEFTQYLPHGKDFYHLGRYATDLAELQHHLSSHVLQDRAFSQALDDLLKTKQHIQIRWQNQIDIGIDVVELRSYHYHTGLVYAVYASHHAVALAQGGRYDGIGEHFGRARPATGFSCDLYTLCTGRFQSLETIVAPARGDASLDIAIQNARQQGRCVVQLLGEDDLSSVPYATHQFQWQDGAWHIINLSV